MYNPVKVNKAKHYGVESGMGSGQKLQRWAANPFLPGNQLCISDLCKTHGLLPNSVPLPTLHVG